MSAPWWALLLIAAGAAWILLCAAVAVALVYIARRL